MTVSSVLIVEDEPVIREQLADILNEMGFSPMQVGSVREATAVLDRDVFAIIILDLGLEDGSGLTVLEQIVRLAPDAPVMVVSSTMDLSLRSHCYELGARDFVAKPFRPDELKRRLNRLIERRGFSE